MILWIWINLYIWSHSTDKPDKEEYMEISEYVV